MTDDQDLQREVMKELEWDPQVNAAHIGVAVKDGAVTLTGHVSTYSEKLAAVQAAERVYGVKAVADEIEVRLPGTGIRDDSDIAEAIAGVLRWNNLVSDTVEAEVRHGFVTLKGEVDWSYQREAAEKAVRDVKGVKGVSNLIAVKPRKAPKPEDIEQRIADAIRRTADLDARRVWVTTSNGTVHLHGTVHSLYEKRIAEQAAAAAPGVEEVDNEIIVVP
jgi:osmotically-inducible protein OsmY